MRVLFRTILLLVGVLALSSCGEEPSKPAVASYVTQYGLGPDKWATAWLLTRRPGADAELQVVPANAPLAEGIPFDAPQAPIRRIGERAAFEVAVSELGVVEPTIRYLAQIVHEIEVNFWAAEGPPEAQLVEDAYRGLQQRHGRDRVPADCYVAFFDRVYTVLRDARKRSVPLHADRLALSCDELAGVAAAREMMIPETPIADVLGAMAVGRRVVFVDVREPDEYAEAHIPGALNISLRDVGPHLVERLSGADYVVSYCVKDFRGFEMAKALADAGVANSVIMRPYGVKGWAQLGLPLTGSRALSEEAAREDLAKCLAARGECLIQRARRRQAAA